MSFRSILSTVWFNTQTLFPILEEQTGELSGDLKRLIAVLETVRIEEFVPCNKWSMGRPTRDRYQIARAFVAKAILKIPYTKELISRLKRDQQLRTICGWSPLSRIPSASTLSRAFKEFSKINLPDKAHQALIAGAYENEYVMHIIKDSTPVEAREKALKKEGTYEERKKQASYRYAKEQKGELVSRRQKQLQSKTVKEMMKDLPMACDVGRKQSGQGLSMRWKGYKIHIAIDDHCVCLAAILTSASLNDCEAAIPLAAKTDEVVKGFYDLMDSAYDVAEVKEHSRRLGHIPIIDAHARGTTAKEEKEREAKARRAVRLYPAEARRYRLRFAKERLNALFKDWFGGKHIYYRGHEKVFCHSMFGILALTATTLIKLVQ